MNFSSNLTDENGDDIDLDINNTFRTDYRSTVNIHLGSEFIVPGYGVKLMAGYYFQPSPLRSDVELQSSDKTYLSGGLSFLLDKQVKLDVAYQYGWWNQTTTDGLLGFDEEGSPLLSVEKRESRRISLGISYRF